jgi:hypothetical protein
MSVSIEMLPLIVLEALQDNPHAGDSTTVPPLRDGFLPGVSILSVDLSDLDR